MTVESQIAAKLKRLESAPDLSDAIYNDELAAEEEILRRRWPNNVVACPYCFSTGAHWSWMRSKCPKPYRFWRCRDCRKQFNLTSGTVLNARKRPLTYYLKVERLAKDGILSARQIAELVDGDFKWTWTLIRKLENNGGKLV